MFISSLINELDITSVLKFSCLDSTGTENQTMLHSWNRDKTFKNVCLKVYGAPVFFTLFINVTDIHPKYMLFQKTGIYLGHALELDEIEHVKQPDTAKIGSFVGLNSSGDV